MRRAAVQVAALWSISLWPGVNFISANWQDIAGEGLGSVLGVLICSLALGAVAHFLWWLAGRRGAAAQVIPFWVAAVCLFFGYLLIRSATADLLVFMNLSAPPSLGWLLLTVVIAGALFRFRRREGMLIASMTFCFVALLSTCVQWIVVATHRPSADAESRAARSMPDGQGDLHRSTRNAYYILLDAYAGATELKRVTGFDDSDFLAAMAQRGFKDVAAERSNYVRTAQTLGAIFSLDYPQTDDPSTWNDDRRLFPRILDGAREPAMVRDLRTSGYAVWQTSSAVSGCSGRHARCMGMRGSLQLDYLTQAFLAPTPVGRFTFYFLVGRADGLEQLVAGLQLMRAELRPFFVFVHNMAPHPPYLLGPDCEPHAPDSDTLNDWSQERKADYVAALTCVNARVLRAVDQILAVDGDAIIVVQSDHGTAFGVDWEKPLDRWSDEAIRERTSFLNLVHVPPGCGHLIDRPLGQINTARFVVACATGHAPDYLPEHSFLSTYSKRVDARALRKVDR